jgi:hypothetical protein
MDRAPTGPCRWSLGETVTLPAPMDPRASRTLLDAQSTRGGPWVVTTDNAGIGQQPGAMIDRLDSRGRRMGFVRLPVIPLGITASLAIDETLGRRALIVESSRGCDFVALGNDATPSEPIRVIFPTGGFSLSGCRALMATSMGYTFLSEQVRAIWGLSVVQLDARGATPMLVGPSVIDGFPPVGYARAALGEGGFVLGSFAGPAMGFVHAQVFDARGQNPGVRSQLRETSDAVDTQGVVVSVDTGAILAWNEANPAGSSVWLRAVDSRGVPQGDAWSPTLLRGGQGSVAAVFTRETLMVSSVMGSGIQRPVVVVGVQRNSEGERLMLPMPDGAVRVTSVRLAATSEGALALYTTNAGTGPSTLTAVPIVCAP